MDDLRRTIGDPPAPSDPLIPAPPQPVRPSAVGSSLNQPLSPSVVRRVLWNLYAVPMTVLVLVASVAATSRLGTWAVVDVAITVPMFVALHLHVWDRRLLPGLVWRCYTFVMAGWQLAYGVVIEPAVTGVSPSPGSFIGLALQLPIFVALFRYAFRTWPVPLAEDATRADAIGDGASSAQAAGRRGGRLAVALSAIGVGVVVLLAVGYRYLPLAASSLAKRALVPKVYEAGVAPPAVPAKGPTRKPLPAAERARLRGLFERGEFGALNAALEKTQADFERDASTELQACEAFRRFSREGDEARLDEWVAATPSHFAPYLARAEYRYETGWRARGHDWASATPEEQFRRMEESFAKAEPDLDAALGTNPRLLEAYIVRLGIHNARGEEAAEDEVFGEAVSLLPRSYLLRNMMVHANLPRWGGTYDEMERIARQAVEDNPDDPAFYKLVGRIYADQADLFLGRELYDRSVTLYTKALSYGEHSAFLEGRGRAHYRSQDYARALADLDRSLELDPDVVSARLLRASVRVRQGEPERADEDARAAEAVSPGDPSVKRWRVWAAAQEAKTGR